MNRSIKIIIGLVVAGLIAGGALFYSSQTHPVDRGSSNSESSEQSINYSPPSEEEIDETDEFKENQKNEDDSSQEEAPNNSSTVNVTLSRVSVGEEVVTVASYVDSSSPGECTLTLLSPQETKHYTNPTESNPTNPDLVNCSTFRVPKEQLSSSDNWTAQVSYEADNYSGQSDTWEFSL